MLTKILSKHNSLLLALACTTGILILSLINKFPEPSGVRINDKIGHTIAYLCLSFFWLTFAKNLTKKAKHFVLVASLCIIYGIVLELLQGTLTTTRTASVFDVFANTLGVIVGSFLVYVVKIGVKK